MSGRKAGLMTQNPIGMNVCPDMERVILPIIPKKAAIRSKCRLLRSQFTAEEKKSLDARIFNRLTNLWRYRECGTLLTYVSNDIEVDTHALIEDALKRSKRVAVPRCIPGLHEMEFYYITSFDDLQKGAYGILEPIKSKCEKLIDLRGYGGDMLRMLYKQSASARKI